MLKILHDGLTMKNQNAMNDFTEYILRDSIVFKSEKIKELCGGVSLFAFDKILDDIVIHWEGVLDST